MNKQIIEKIKLNLMKIEKIKGDEKDAILHALTDIQESFDKIYTKILPKMAKDKVSKETVQDLLWDIREEFRHIEYHIQDSNILDL